MTDNSLPEPDLVDQTADQSDSDQAKKGEGLPLWIPLAGLVAAFAFAVFVGVQICPTLSGVVMPPSAPLPTTGTMTLLKHEQKGTGLDEWLYGTDEKGCAVANYYQKRLSECSFDPDSNCNSPVGTRPLQSDTGQLVVRCSGADSFGAYRVLWTVYVSTGYAEQGLTHFRVTREVGN